jgi:hypothetical protein
MLDLYQSTYRAMVPTINPFDFLQNPMAPGAAQPASAQAAATEDKTPAASVGTESGELTQLKARLAELEKAISTIAPRKATRTAAKTPRKAPARKGSSRKK